MLLELERKRIVSVCNQMTADGFAVGTAGNVSIYNRKEKLIALSPTGVPYSVLTAEDVSVIDEKDNLIEGKQPTSEVDMHCIYYKNREDVNSVLHAHTTYSTMVACFRESLPAIHYTIACANDKEVRCAEYASYGTYELAVNSFKAMGKSKAVFLANHGILTVAENIDVAYNILTQIEFIAHLYILAKQTGDKPFILDDKEVLGMIDRFKNYGQKPVRK